MSETIKIGPDTWEKALYPLLLVYENAETQKARNDAQAMLMNMAKVADLVPALIESLKRIAATSPRRNKKGWIDPIELEHIIRIAKTAIPANQ